MDIFKRILAACLAAVLLTSSLAVPALAQATMSIGGINVPGACTASGATPQTCNGFQGVATTGTLTTAAATNAAYVINNSQVAATSRVHCSVLGYSGTIVTNGYPIIISCVPGAGTITVNLTNTHAANALNGTVAIGFSVFN